MEPQVYLNDKVKANNASQGGADHFLFVKQRSIKTCVTFGVLRTDTQFSQHFFKKGLSLVSSLKFLDFKGAENKKKKRRRKLNVHCVVIHHRYILLPSMATYQTNEINEASSLIRNHCKISCQHVTMTFDYHIKWQLVITIS